MPRSQRQGKRANASRKQARAVRSTPVQVESPDADAVVSAPAAPAARSTRPYQTGKKAAAPARPVVANVLTREQEYAFIREDLTRLLVTSGILTVLMIALLFAIDR